MTNEKLIHFVFFETGLDKEHFIPKWREYSQADKVSENVIMLQSAKENSFRYITQHRCAAGEFEFVFDKGGNRSTRIRQVPIITTLAGGYSIEDEPNTNCCIANECKVFAFLSESSAGLESFSQLADKGNLNIYKAYYENCKFSYILEYFVKDEYATDLIKSLKENNSVETGIFKVCVGQ